MADKKPIILDGADLKQLGSSDTIGISDGGTGQTTANAAVNALLPSQTGNSGKYLTTDGTDTSWADVSSSGGSSYFECTVGASGADYTTLGAAITAGKTRILVIDDTTETGDITLPSNCMIEGIGMEKVEIGMGDNIFSLGVNDEYTFKNLTLSYAFTTSKTLLDNSSKNLYMYNIHIINNSALANTRMTYDSTSLQTNKSEFINMKLTLPNYGTTGMEIRYATANNIKIYPSTNTTYAIRAIGCLIDNVVLTQNADIGTSTDIMYTADSRVSNIYSRYGCKVNLNGQITNLYLSDNGCRTYLSGNISNSEILGYIYPTTNTNFSNCDLQYITFAADCIYSGCRFRNQFNCTTTRNVFTGCYFYFITSLTLGGNYNAINGGICNSSSAANISVTGNKCSITQFQTTGNITISGDDNTISTCRVGADTGSGSNTITVSSGANRTIIGMCRTDMAIVDSGTDTVGIGNVVY